MNLTNKIILGVLIAITIYLIWPWESTEVANINHLTIIRNANNDVSVMGILIGTHSLQTAEQLLQDQADTALFIPAKKDKEQDLQLEAYFKKHQIILGLNADIALLEKIKNVGKDAFVFPSGVVKVSIDAQESIAVKALLINSMTLMYQNRIALDEFRRRYGEPEQTIQSNDANTHFLYPKLGLDFMRSVEGADVLQFVNPSQFTRLLDPLIDSASSTQATR